MAGNRFEQFNPKDFVQTYDPFPVDKAMQLMQLKRGREDKVSGMLGKANAAGILQGGLATQKQAAQINAQRQAQIADLSDAYASGRTSYQEVSNQLMKIQSDWANDKGANFVKSDYELKDVILANQAKEGYGLNFRYDALDEDGNYNIGDIDSYIAEGKLATPNMYGLATNPGSEKAFGSTLDLVNADLEQTHKKVKNADGDIVWEAKDTTQNLDMDTFIEKAGPYIQSFKDKDGNLSNLDNASPELRAFINWKSEGGKKDYKYDDLVADFKLEARKRIKLSEKTYGADGDDDGSGSTTIIDENGDPFITPITVDREQKQIDAELKKVDSLRKANTSTEMGLNGNIKNSRNHYNLKNILNADKEYETKQYDETYQSFLAEDQAANPIVPGTGKKRFTDAEIQRSARSKTMKHIQRQRLHAKAYQEAVLEAMDKGTVKVPTLNDEGYAEDIFSPIAGENDPWWKKAGVFVADTYNDIMGDYSEFMDIYEDKVESTFGEQTYTVAEYKIHTEAEGMSTKEVPYAHKQITDAASFQAKNSSTAIWRTGQQLNSLNAGDDGSTDGQSIDALYTDDEKGTTSFRGADYKTESFFYDHVNNKWFARGYYYKPGDEARSSDVRSALYDIDITKTMMESVLSGDEKADLVFEDQVADFMTYIPKGGHMFANIGLSEDATDKYGDIKVSMTFSGTWQVEGNFTDSRTGKMTSIKQVLEKDLNQDSDNLTYDGAKSIIKNLHMYQEQGAMNLQGPKFDAAEVTTALDSAVSSDIANTLWQEVQIEGDVAKEVMTDFSRSIMSIESSNGTNNVMGGFNKQYLGIYQLGKDAIEDASKLLGIDVPSNEKLLKDPELQSKMFQAHTLRNHRTWMANDDYANLSYPEKMAVLAYTHNSGIGNAQKTFSFQRDMDNQLIGGDFKDGAGTPSQEYFNETLKRLQKYAR